MKKAIITGITGQDGAFLARFLLEKGYKVYGTYRQKTTNNFHNLEKFNIKDKINLVEVDIDDVSSIINLLQTVKPDEFYNLAALSFVGASWTHPINYCKTNALAVVNMLEAIRLTDKSIKYYQASTSELFGSSPAPQNENTPFQPNSPYATAKLYAHWITNNYRESFCMFACSGILMNHESEIRGQEFLTQKVVKSVVEIMRGNLDCLEIGNMYAQRDWGYAGDFVEAMWLMLQQDKPDNYVIATGETHTVKEFITECFNRFGVNIKWQGEGLNEIGLNGDKIVVKVNPQFYRPNEVNVLQGDYTKAKNILGWQPKIYFNELIEIMLKDAVK